MPSSLRKKRALNRKAYETNKETRLARLKNNNISNSAPIKEYSREYHKHNRASRNAASQQYYNDHKDEKRESNIQYYNAQQLSCHMLSLTNQPVLYPVFSISLFNLRSPNLVTKMHYEKTILHPQL